MAFEAEVIPLFIGGCAVVSLLELVLGRMMLRSNPKARRCFTAHVGAMVIALVFLVRCIFAPWLEGEVGIASISNSVSIGLFGIFWSISVGFGIGTIDDLRGS